MDRHGGIASGRRTGQPAAFTLIEVMVVVAVIGLLAALTAGVARPILQQVYVRQTQVMMGAIYDKVKTYHGSHREYPEGDMQALIDALRGVDDTDIAGIVGQRFYKGGQVVDAWDRPVRYLYSKTGDISGSQSLKDYFVRMNRTPLLVSDGPDATADTADDVIFPAP